MATYPLTDDQKESLRRLVERHRLGLLGDPFLIVQSRGGCTLLGSKGNDEYGEIEVKSIGDIDALIEQGFPVLRYGGSGTPNCSLRQPAFDAVDADFELPVEAPSAIIGAFINNVIGGNVQAMAIAEAVNSQFSQTINDPQAFVDQLDDICERLVEATESELPSTELLKYLQEIERLKVNLKSDSPESGVVRRILATLGFLGDLEGSISLVLRVWPYLYPLVALAAAKLS